MSGPDESGPGGFGAAPVLLRAGGVALLLDLTGPRLPRVLYWGADPGPLDPDACRALAADLRPGLPNSAPDQPWSLPLLPGQPDGWSGTPGLAGHRDGADPFPRLLAVEPLPAAESLPTAEPDGAWSVTARAVDPDAGIEVGCELRLEASGLVRIRHTVTSTGPGVYTVDALLASLPVPDQAGELLDLTGRWCRERSPQRRPFDHGTHARRVASRPDRSRRDPAAGLWHARVRFPQRRGLGGARGLERQPSAPGRAAAGGRRTGWQCAAGGR